MTEVKCDCGTTFESEAIKPTCPDCRKRFRGETHRVTRVVPRKEQNVPPKTRSFEEAKCEVPASWIPMFAIWGLNYLSAYKNKTRPGASTGFFYDHTREVTNALIGSNLNEVKKMLNKIEDLKFKLSILNIGD